MDFTNEHELRAFLRLCIDPGLGRDKRTPVRLTEALPGPAITALDRLAPPYLRAYRKTAADLRNSADQMSHAYATAVLAWIREEQPTDELHDLVTAASLHSRECRDCSSGGTLAHRCDEALRIAAQLLAPAPAAEDRAQHCGGAALTHDETGICNHLTAPAAEETPCAHESWEVTSEYPEGEKWKTWVQSRRCTDCRERLDDIRSAEPHFEEHRAGTAAAAAQLGHSTVLETAARYLGEDDRPPMPSVLPWLEALRGEEFGNLLGEITLAVHHGKAPREGESTDDRHRRTVGLIDYVLARWRDAMEHRKPTSYLTRDGRVWAYRGEHQANGGPALYESPTSPKAYTVAELRDVYGWVAAIEGEAPADGEMVTTSFEDYARVCRREGLTPFTTALVRGGVSPEVHAAVHVSLDPDLELGTDAVDAVITAVCDGLTVREEA